MSKSSERRRELSRAIRDELATIRAINSGLRLVMSDADRAKLTTARADSLDVLRGLLTQFNPKEAPCPIHN